MEQVDTARAKFVSSLDGKIEGSATAIFDEGLKMTEAGSSIDEIKAYLDNALVLVGDTSRGQGAAHCSSECKGECSGVPAEFGMWAACYAGCFAGCMVG